MAKPKGRIDGRPCYGGKDERTRANKKADGNRHPLCFAIKKKSLPMRHVNVHGRRRRGCVTNAPLKIVCTDGGTGCTKAGTIKQRAQGESVTESHSRNDSLDHKRAGSVIHITRTIEVVCRDGGTVR